MLFEKQKYQEDCVESIALTIDSGVDFFENDFSKLRSSINTLYTQKGYKQFSISDKKKFDVLMETGTGKTFTYIKTIFEINKRFKKNKFIIVVPRSAIRLGVVQNINLTKEYFFNEYNKYLNIIEYPKDGVSKVESDFLRSDRLSVMILTNSAFAGKDKRINRMPESGDLFKNGTLWENITHENPIVIIDEPHLLIGDRAVEYLDKLDTLFIRFGATYPADKEHGLSNVVYALDSISSFNQYLVKKIRVNTVFSDGEMGGYKISNIQSKENKFQISYFLNQENYTKDIGLKQDIGQLTGLDTMKGVSATKITAHEIFLSNHTTLKMETSYTLTDEETRLMIRKTISKHFEKEEKLFNQGIKTLSLFFIPNIADFKGDNPRIKNMFEEEYRALRETVYRSTSNKPYKAFLDKDFKEGQLRVHQGYFSGSKGTADEKEAKEVEIILKDKEKLLSFDENLRFIFSVWALQEGWDNPNIFNICKLSNTEKETSRRQQVGRGLRIAVNQAGKRLTHKYLNEDENAFYSINTLDMVVSSKEQDFISKIQSEIIEASFSVAGDILTAGLLKDKGLNEREISRFLTALEDKGIIVYDAIKDSYEIKSNIAEFMTENRSALSFLDDTRFEEVKALFKENNRIRVENGNKAEKKVKIRADKMAEFKELWETINRKSKIVYKGIEEERLIDAIAKNFNVEIIDPIEAKVIEKEYHSQENRIIFKKTEMLSKIDFFRDGTYSKWMDSFIKEDISFRFPLPFMIKLMNKLDRVKINNNPSKAKELLKKHIKDNLHHSLLQKINYQFENEVKITSLQNDNPQSPDYKKYLTEIKSGLLGRFTDEALKAPDHLLYDAIVWDSVIEKTIQMEDCAEVNDNKITVFAKLPHISIPTPYKNYNPDFAYLVKKADGKQLFLVVETKGYQSEQDIPEEEKQKINYAKKFFESLQKELPHIDIQFKTRVNKQELGDLLREIGKGTKQ